MSHNVSRKYSVQIINKLRTKMHASDESFNRFKKSSTS